MKKMRFFIIGLFLCVLVFADIGPVKAAEKCKLYIDITFKENLLFDKYDIELMLDGQQTGMLPYGEPYTMMTEVDPGVHTIQFCKATNSEVSGAEEINISEDSTYRATVQTDKKKIKIISSEIIETLEGSSILITDMSFLFLSDAKALLEEKGCNNITFEGQDGDKVKKEKNWIVISQNTAAGKTVDKNEEVKLICQRIPDFLNEHFTGKNVIEAVQAASDVGYEISFVNALTGRDLRNTFDTANSEELNRWTVDEETVVDSNLKVAQLHVSYHGKVLVPNVVGMSLQNAQEELKFAGIGNIVPTNEEKKNIAGDKGEEYKVLYQSILPGTEIDAEGEIELECRAYHDLSEISIYELNPTVSVREEPETVKEILIETETAQESTEKETETEPEKVTERDNQSEKITEERKAEIEGVEEDTFLQIIPIVPSGEEDVHTARIASVQEETEAETQKPRTKITYTSKSVLNVRSGPSTDAEKLGELGIYDTVDVYEIDGNWALIDFNGKDAYVSAKYIQKGIVKPLITPETDAPVSDVTRAAEETAPVNEGPLVWISQTGKKYHSRSSCSNMNNPTQVTRSEAEARGLTPCKKCY